MAMVKVMVCQVRVSVTLHWEGQAVGGDGEGDDLPG